MYSNEKSRAVLWDVVRFGALSIRSTEDGCWGLSKDYLEHAERIGATGNLPRMTGQLVEELSLSLRVPVATRDWLIIAASERGLLWRIPEFALRCAQHIARVAANLHAHERYTGNLISLETLRQAILAVRDCADSYHMLFGRVHLEENQRDAIPILSFMVHCYNKPTQYQSQFVFDVQFLCRRTWGGQQVRKLDRLMAALTSLADAGILEWSSHMYNGHPVSVQLTRDFRTQFDAAHPKLFRPY